MTELLVASRAQSESGKRNNKRLRRTGFIPGVIYAAKTEPSSISMEHKLIKKLIQDGHGNEVITLSLDNKTKLDVILKDKQYHPFKDELLHVDFLAVSKNTKISKKIAIVLQNEDIAAGVKAGGALAQQTNEIEIECLPADLPEAIYVDVKDLQLESSVHLSDLTLPKGVAFLHPVEAKSDHDQPVVSINTKKVAAEDDADSDTQTDTE